MAQCVQRSLRECLRGKLKLLQRGTRSLSDQTFVKQTTSPEEHVFLDLELVHKEWKTAGYFPRAPPHVTSHSAKCLSTILHHSNIFRHVFGGEEYRMFPLRAHFNGKHFDFGGIHSPSQAASPPEVSLDLHNLNADKKYTLMMLSPDCTSCGIHWCVSDISASQPLSPDATASDSNVRSEYDVTTVLDYVPPVPLKGAGFYRYVLVLLEQNSTPPSVCRSDTLPQLISKYELVPVGLAFFQSCWDSTVGHTLANHLDMDEKQFVVQRTKDNQEHYAEELFLKKEWEMKTAFM